MPDPVPPAINTPEYSVSDLSGAIKRNLEDRFGLVRVRGEMGRVTIARSGHVYVDLKDAGAVLAGVMWKGVAAALRFRPEEGLEVVATGRISTFPGSSKYQLIIERMEPAGVGALLQQLEQRRKRLADEGLFDQTRKRVIPYLPTVIGVVTSPTGAVIQDILHRLSDRFPVRVLLWPVLVQGDKAAGQVARAIAGFNALPAGGAVPRPDVLIVARGGGSIEDLWAFNEEAVVRAAAASDIPLISAVGHETDTTLIDFVSDLRAPTPTGAAEKAVPVRADLAERLALIGARLGRGLTRGLENGRVALRAAAARLPKAEALLQGPRQRLDLAEARLVPSLRALVERRAGRLAVAGARLRPETLTREMNRRGARLAELAGRLDGAMARRARGEGERLAHGARRLTRAGEGLDLAVRRALRARADRLEGQGRLLASLDWRAVLARGYVVARDPAGRIVAGVGGARPGAELTLTWADGEAVATVKGGDGPPASAPARATPAKAAPPKARTPDQGDLF
jgi:exodeoxyribonuclease VII large subunit